MLKVHQDGIFLPLELKTPDYTHSGESIPAVSASATRDEQGSIHLSLINTDAKRAVPVRCSLRGTSASAVKGRILTATKVNSHNTFDQPDSVRPEPFLEAQIAEGTLATTLPAKSIVILELDSQN
jgi:alpha-N-arabinofuranosidase